MMKWIVKKRWRIILSGTLIVTLPIVGLALFVYIEISGHLNKIIKEENSQAAINIAVHINEQLQNEIRNGSLFTTRLLLKDAVRQSNREKITRHLKDFIEHVSSIERAFVVDKQGTVIASYSEDRDLIGKSFSDRDWYKGVSRNWEPYVSEYYLRAARPQRYVFAISLPIRDFDNSVIGILVLQPAENYIQDAIAHIPAPKNQKVYIVDNKGNLIYQPDYKVDKLIDFTGFPSVKKVINGQSGVETLTNPDGASMLTAYQPVKQWGWGVIVQRPEQEVYASLRKLTYGLFSFTAIMIAIGVLLAYRRSETIFSLKKLSGELETRVGERTEELTLAIEFLRSEADSRQEAEKILQERQAYLSAIIENQPGLVWLKDTEGRFLAVNQAFADACQRQTPGEVEGKTDLDIWPHELAEKYRTDDAKVMQTNRSAMLEEIVHNKGEAKWFETFKTPVRDVSGNIIGTTGYAHDITERRKLEAQYLQAQKMESIGTLAGGIAHDFNNILNVILGYSTMVFDKVEVDSPLKEQMNEVLIAADRATNLTKDLLLFSRKQISEKKSVELNEIIRKVEKFLKRVIGEDIECKTTITEHPLTVFADSHQLEQVLMNLATNARDSMPNGGVFAVTAEEVDLNEDFTSAHGYGKPGHYAMITVSDTGIGIDEATLKHIFEPFFTTKEVGKGTGLGLAVVYGIIRQHDGFINVYSEPGKGTTFRIYIPLVNKETEKIEKEETIAPKGGTEAILIAEDDVSVRKLIKNILEEVGYRIIEAVDGNDAVKKFRDNKDKVKLILTDLIMPGKNGMDAYEDIKGIRHDIRAIFISGYARDIIQRFGIEEGIVFISKPVLPSELLRKVREALDK